jgi:hypothetical protein
MLPTLENNQRNKKAFQVKTGENNLYCGTIERLQIKSCVYVKIR